MSQTGAIWLVILAALVAANLPFLNHRVALVGPVASPRKGLLIRLVELVVLYFLVGGFAMLLERRAGQNAPRVGVLRHHRYVVSHAGVSGLCVPVSIAPP